MPSPTTTADDAPERASVGTRLAAATRRNWPLLLVAVLGLVLRLFFVTVWWPTCDYDATIWLPGGVTLEEGLDKVKNPERECFDVASGDSTFYFGQGQMIAEGEGLGSPFNYFINGDYQPSAAHPPGYPAFLAAANLVGLTTVGQQRIASTVLGGLGVFLIGLVGKRLGGMRAGVLAAGLGAAYPMLWINDGKLMSESLFIPMVAVVLLAAYAFWDKPRPRTAILLGVAIAAAQLVRAETGMLAWIMVPFLAWGVRDRLRGTAWLKLGAVAIITAQVVVLPWTLRNLTSFDRPIFGSAGVGIVLLSGSCDAAYYDEDTLGLLNFKCLEDDPEALGFILSAIAPGTGDDESVVDFQAREKAIDYILDNPGRTPVVVAARIGRIWDVYRPGQNIDVDVFLEVRPRGPSIAGRVMYFAMLPVAIVGLVVLRRRKLPISPFLTIFLMTTATAMISFALSRYRVPSEVALVVLAGVGIDALARQWWDPRHRPAVAGEGPAPSAATTPAASDRMTARGRPAGRADGPADEEGT